MLNTIKEDYEALRKHSNNKISYFSAFLKYKNVRILYFYRKGQYHLKKNHNIYIYIN